MTHSPRSVRANRPGALLLTLIALLSLLYDGAVVQTHEHAFQKLVTARVQASGASLDEACALCAAAASLDALLLPISPDWRMPVAAAIIVPLFTRLSVPPHQRAHHWRSRAPPGSSPPR